VIGKEGEATVWEMLETVIVPEFPYAEIKNMSGVSHAADFHLWVMGASGKRMKFLIDSKKYKRAVNTDEVNKLSADVDGDNEAHGGLLVSLTSPICAMRQFQIRCTDKGKPILYLSFADMDSADHAKLMCWGIRSLLAAVHETGEETTMEIERIEELLTDICTSLKEVDGMVKTQQKLMDSMRGLKTTVLQRIADFRQGSHTENDECAAPSGCCAVLKTTCMPCGKEVVGDTGRCKQHSVRVKS